MADGVIRCMPGEDKTNGFFVACFVKRSSSPIKTKATKAAKPSIKGDKTGGKKRGRSETVQEEATAAAIGAAEADDEEEVNVEGDEVDGSGDVEIKEAKAKTDAQKARKKRKKQSQKVRA